MRFFRAKRVWAVVTAGGAVAAAFVAGAVVAQQPDTQGASAGPSVVTLANGGGQASYHIVRRDDPLTFTNAAFANIPSAAIALSIGPNSTRLVVARFFAESEVHNLGGSVAQNWGSVRIVAHNTTTGAITELAPVAGLDFSFDSSDAGRESLASWEAHAMERSARLGPGNYRIFAQAAVTDFDAARAPSASMRLDDYSFSVETSL